MPGERFDVLALERAKPWDAEAASAIIHPARAYHANLAQRIVPERRMVNSELRR